MRCAKFLMLWCLQKTQEYWWQVEALCKHPESKELVQIAGEHRSVLVQLATGENRVVLRGVGVVLGADRGAADGTAVLILVARGKHEQEMLPNRLSPLAGSAEEFGSFEGIVLPLIRHVASLPTSGPGIKPGDEIRPASR